MEEQKLCDVSTNPLTLEKEQEILQWVIEQEQKARPLTPRIIRNKLQKLIPEIEWHPSDIFIIDLCNKAGVSVKQAKLRKEGTSREQFEKERDHFLYNANHWPASRLYAASWFHVLRQEESGIKIVSIDDAVPALRLAMTDPIPELSVIAAIRADGKLGPQMVVFHHLMHSSNPNEACIMEQSGVPCDCSERDVLDVHECHWNYYIQHMFGPKLEENSAVILGQMPFLLHEHTRVQLSLRKSTPLYLYPAIAREVSPFANSWLVKPRNQIFQEVENSIDRSPTVVLSIIEKVLLQYENTIESHFRARGIDGSLANENVIPYVSPPLALSVLPLGPTPEGVRLGRRQNRSDMSLVEVVKYKEPPAFVLNEKLQESDKALDSVESNVNGQNVDYMDADTQESRNKRLRKK